MVQKNSITHHSVNHFSSHENEGKAQGCRDTGSIGIHLEEHRVRSSHSSVLLFILGGCICAQSLTTKFHRSGMARMASAMRVKSVKVYRSLVIALSITSPLIKDNPDNNQPVACTASSTWEQGRERNYKGKLLK